MKPFVHPDSGERMRSTDIQDGELNTDQAIEMAKVTALEGIEEAVTKWLSRIDISVSMINVDR